MIDSVTEAGSYSQRNEQASDPKQPRSYVLEQLDEINREIESDDDQDFEYDEIPMEDLALSETDSDAGDETLERAILKLQQKHFISQAGKGGYTH